MAEREKLEWTVIEAAKCWACGVRETPGMPRWDLAILRAVRELEVATEEPRTARSAAPQPQQPRPKD